MVYAPTIPDVKGFDPGRPPMKQFLPVIAALSLLALGTPAAHATIIKGSLTFDDNAFIDSYLGSGGNVSVLTGSVATNLLGDDLSQEVLLWPGDPQVGDGFIDLAFTDNVAYNGPGADLAIFEAVGVDPMNVTIEVGGTTLLVTPVDAGFTDGVSQNVALIDLSDFGFAPGAEISTLRLAYAPGYGGAEPTGIGALNSRTVPEPCSLALLGIGLAGIGFARKRMKA